MTALFVILTIGGLLLSLITENPSYRQDDKKTLFLGL
jgi:hypothetical protein